MPQSFIKKYIYCYHLFILCSLQTASAQYADKDFTRYSAKDGLSDNVITCIQQDDQGYLWIGTDAGLNRFDGNRFKNFYQNTDPLHLRSGSIMKLKCFGNNRLGILSKGGFQLLNTSNYKVEDFVVPDNTPFTTYANSAWDAEELPGNSFAVTTAAGFYVFNNSGDVVFSHVPHSVKEIGKKRILYGRDFLKLSNNNYLVYVNEDRLAQFDVAKRAFNELDRSDSVWSQFLHSPGQPKEYWVVKYQLNRNEFIFVPRSQKDRIVFYNRASNKWVASSLPPHMTDSLNWESKISFLNDTVLAINSRTNGFYLMQFDPKTGAISCDGKKYLRDYKIICLYTDKNKRLWAGTTEGLLKQELHPRVINAFRYQPTGGEKYTGGFNCAYRYKDKLYAGRFSLSKGLAIIDADNMKLLKEIDFYGTHSEWNEIRSIEMYHQDTLWLGSNGGLLWFDTKTDHYGKVVEKGDFPWADKLFPVLAPVRKDGYAWMCSILSGLVLRYHVPTRTFTAFTAQTNPALPFDRVKSVVYDSYGDVWIGGHSLARYNIQKRFFDTLITVYEGANKFSDDIVTIRADDDGSLWLHNMYNGLLEYRIKEKQFITYSMKDGLPSDLLYSFSPVVDHKLWIASNNHLTLFNTRTKKFTIYDTDDGLPEQKPFGRRMYYDEGSGMVYLCTTEYLVRFPLVPGEIPDYSSDLIIEEFSNGNNKTVHLPGIDLDMKYNENNVTLSYAVIDYEKKNYQFSYRLNGKDSWIATGNQRSITMSNLSPGKYTIELKASGKPGIEKTKNFTFTIHPPFWSTWWFISLAVLLVTATVYFVYMNRVRYIRQKANIDKLLSQTEMKALQAQMNPHFIFNSLNSIREMILNNGNKEASHYLSKFAHLIRITLDQSSQTLVSLRHTIDYLERYMEMENIRNSLFTYQVVVDEQLDIDETVLPPMLIQPFIENAIWHGVSASRKNIHVRIEFKKIGESLVCRIDDNGIGLRQSQKMKKENASTHQSVGIANIQNRIWLLNEKYDLDCNISVEDKMEINGSEEAGTLVTLQMPLEIRES